MGVPPNIPEIFLKSAAQGGVRTPLTPHCARPCIFEVDPYCIVMSYEYIFESARYLMLPETLRGATCSWNTELYYSNGPIFSKLQLFLIGNHICAETDYSLERLTNSFCSVCLVKTKKVTK